MHNEFTKNKIRAYDFQFPLPIRTAGIDNYESVFHDAYEVTNENNKFIGMNPECDQEELIFDSKFECGNLD